MPTRWAGTGRPWSDGTFTEAHHRGVMSTNGVEGRVVIVTGAGQGIGAGMARHLATHGATVVVVDWKAHRVERTVAELVESGWSCVGLTADVNDHDSITDMVAATVDRFGRVDGLVNNAHTFTPKSGPGRPRRIADVDTNLATLQGDAVGDAGGASAHASRGVGPDRELRVGGRHHRHGRVRRVQRVERGHPRAHAHGGARSGAATASSSTPSHPVPRRSEDRRLPRETTPRIASSSATTRWDVRATLSTTSVRWPCSCAAMPAGS